MRTVTTWADDTTWFFEYMHTIYCNWQQLGGHMGEAVEVFIMVDFVCLDMIHLGIQHQSLRIMEADRSLYPNRLLKSLTLSFSRLVSCSCARVSIEMAIGHRVSLHAVYTLGEVPKSLKGRVSLPSRVRYQIFFCRSFSFWKSSGGRRDPDAHPPYRHALYVCTTQP